MNSLDKLIKLAIIEDIGEGDHTSMACIPPKSEGKAQLLAKEKGIIAGVSLAKKIFNIIDPSLTFHPFYKDGDSVNVKDVVFHVKGNVLSILKGERLVLNYMQRMSGIATKTHQYCSLIKDLKTKILDTRKTSPNLREVEKWAVKIGGGENHRTGLYDMMMIKDNHIDYAGGITQAIVSANKYLQNNNKKIKIEVEARNLNEVIEIIETGQVDRIMLDNFSFSDLKKAITMINGKYETEASGNITAKSLREYAKCGVDYISVGALTHQINSLDLSLKAIKDE